MSNPGDFVIENGVLKKYVGPGGDVVVPEGVTSIGNSAFQWCSSLVSIALPEGVTSIGEEAFRGCKGLADHSGFVIAKGILFDYAGPGGDVVVPEGVTSIGDKAFSGCSSLKSITIPEGVTSIGEWAFSDCANLRSITLPEGLQTLGRRAFADCKALEEAFLPNSLTKMEYGIFYGCPHVAIHTNAGSYAERFLQDYDPASRKDRKFQEWRQIFSFSMRSAGAYVKGCYVDAPMIYLPDNFGKAQVVYARNAFREDAAFLCSEEVFKKLPLSNKYSTVRAYLYDNALFNNAEREYLSAFVKKNHTAMIIYYAKKADYETVRILMKLKKLTQAAVDKLLTAFEDAETRMMLLAIRNEEQS